MAVLVVLAQLVPAVEAPAQGPPPVGSPCSKMPVRLEAGALVPAPYLAAVQFLSDGTGVGFTASDISCSNGPGGGSFEPFPVWEVVTHDGGQTWRAAGAELPRSLVPRFSDAAIDFGSVERGWAEAGGVVAYTSDGGDRWEVKNLDGTVDALVADGASAAALVVQPRTRSTRVWRLSPAGDLTSRTAPATAPPDMAYAGGDLAVEPQSQQVFVAPEAWDAGILTIGWTAGSWSRLNTACHGSVQSLLVPPEGGLTLVCGYGASMNKNPKAVMVSSDGGRSWRVLSSWGPTGPDSSDRSGLPTTDFLDAAFAPSGTYYMATTLGLASSTDGGRNWVPLDVAGKGLDLPANSASGAQFSFAGPAHGWLLLEGEALLRTVDGHRWTAVGPVAI